MFIYWIVANVHTEEFDELSKNMKWDIFAPIMFRGHPTKEQLEKAENLAAELARQIKKIPNKISDENK